MEKTVAYIATAILLGIVAVLPVIVLTPKTPDEGYYAIEQYALGCPKGDVERLQKLEEVGTATVPSGPFHIGLILALSFVFALGVSFYFKRQMF
jgi:hypothetical protein